MALRGSFLLYFVVRFLLFLLLASYVYFSVFNHISLAAAVFLGGNRDLGRACAVVLSHG